MRRQRLGRLIGFFSLILLIIPLGIALQRVSASSLSVSLSVGQTYFAVDGFTSPSAIVTIKENNAVLATTTADLDGAFSFNILDADGLHTYQIYGTDITNRHTSTVVQTVSLTPGMTTTLNGLILPPTITLDDTEAAIGDDLHLNGYGIPATDIQIFVDTSLMTTVATDSVGYWEALISTSDRSTGTHSVFARNLYSGGSFSLESVISSFTLTARAPGTGNSNSNSATSPLSSPASLVASPGVSRISTLSASPEPRLPSWLRIFDINGNDRLTLDELRDSLLLWARGLQNQETGTCDLDQDADCDLHDFSILLYYIDR